MMRKLTARAVIVVAWTGTLLSLCTGYTQVFIDDSVPLAVQVVVAANGTVATVHWTTGYPPDNPNVLAWKATNTTSWIPTNASSTRYPATSAFDPLGNPRYHYQSVLHHLVPHTDYFALPSDFHPTQDFINRRAVGHRLCFTSTPNSTWGAGWLVPGTGQQGPQYWNQYMSPQQVHLSWGHSTTDMIVMWAVTLCPTRAALRYRPVGAPWQQATVVPVDSITNVTVDGTTRWMVRVALGGGAREGASSLPYDTLFAYEALNVYGNETYASPPYSFRTPPAPSVWEPQLAVFGDMGLSDGLSAPSLTLAAALDGVDAVVHVGDIAYDMSTDGGQIGDRYFNGVEPVASQVPYLASIGNHDLPSDFAARFAFPAPKQAGNLYYSLDIGPIHLVAYNTEMVWGGLTPALQAQYDWLDADLTRANANRHNVPWIVVHGHRPMYCSYSQYADCDSYGSTTASSRRGVYVNGTWHLNLEDLFAHHKVNLGMFGHVHSYERFVGVYDWQRPPGAMVHVISGAAGTAEGDDPFNGPALNITAFRSQGRGYGILRASKSRLQWVQRECGWDNCTNGIIDSFTMVQ